MSEFKKYQTSIEELRSRVDTISAVSLTLDERLKAYKTILGCIDLTTLSGDDTFSKVRSLCRQAMEFEDKKPGIPATAAVCVYPVFAKTVSSELKNSEVRTACVAGAFPSGQSPLFVRIEEVRYAVENGADDIDMVISRGRLLEGDEDYIFEEVSSIKKACGDAHLKVILETGELKEPSLIRRASEIAVKAGADFLKTSTGKIQPAATPEAYLVMLDTIREYYEMTGKKIGIKPAGGISEPEDALLYYNLTKSVLGEDWLNKELFRIGASRLASKVYNKIIELTTV